LPPRFHRDLTDALNRQSVEAADRAMREHVRHGLEPIVKALGARQTSARFERVK
jgi:DNA-binding GntR family transcriptional regulator